MPRPRIISEPVPGYYKLRHVKGGPWMAARIEQLCVCEESGIEGAAAECSDACERYGALRLTIAGDEPITDQAEILRRWTWLHETTRADHDYLAALHEWAAANDPTHPYARPREPVDLSEQPSLF